LAQAIIAQAPLRLFEISHFFHSFRFIAAMAVAAEQEEKLGMLMAFAGDMVDADLAKVMLESADWDVERALNGLLEDAGPSGGSGAPAGVSMPPDSSRLSGADSQEGELSSQDIRALLDAYDVDHSTCLAKADLVNLLEKTVGDQERLQADQERLRAEPQDPFPMHAIQHMFADMFSESTTRASSADSEDFPENWAHRLKVICEKFPSVPRSQVITLLKKHNGAACVAEEDLRSIIHAEEVQAQQNAERRAEIDMQDEEYRESLLMDQQREEERKKAELEERKQVQEVMQQQEEEAQAIREAQMAFELKRARVEQPEPDKSHPDRCEIVIRNPTGKRLKRTFLGSDSVSFVYDWIDVACAEESFIKGSYQLVARLPGKPNKELHNSQQTLKDEGVEHQTVFLINCS